MEDVFPLVNVAVNGVVIELLSFSLKSSSISLFLVMGSLDAKDISVIRKIEKRNALERH